MISWKTAVAPENPTTSEAVRCIGNCCGSSKGEVKLGVVPAKVRVEESKLIHDGNGVLSPKLA